MDGYVVTLNITDTRFWFTVVVGVEVQDSPEPPVINDASFSIAEDDAGYAANVLLGRGASHAALHTRAHTRTHTHTVTQSVLFWRLHAVCLRGSCAVHCSRVRVCGRKAAFTVPPSAAAPCVAPHLPLTPLPPHPPRAVNASDPDFNTVLYYSIANRDGALNVNKQALLEISPVGDWTEVTLLASLRLDFEFQNVLRIQIIVADSLSVGKLEDTAVVSVNVLDVNDLAVVGAFREDGSGRPATDMATVGGEPFLVVGRNLGMTPDFLAANPTFVPPPPVVTYGGPNGTMYTAVNCSVAFGNTVVRGCGFCGWHAFTAGRFVFGVWCVLWRV
jgi:hypothetical protein